MRIVLLATGLLSLAACVSSPPNAKFVSDMHGNDIGQYNIDLGECDQYAAAQPTRGEAAASGAVEGAG